MPFHLTTEPWIPCRDLRGNLRELGFADALARAHELESVCDASPLVTLALHRLLLAILHRTFGPPDIASWRALYSRGSFDTARLEAYFDATRDRFDLTHPERPFFQVRGLTALYEPDGIGRLVLERSYYGAAMNVFQNRPRTSTREGIAFGSAARHLVALHGFAPGGLVRKKDEPGSATAAPLNRGAFVLVRGQSLFETLMLNLLVYAPDRDLPIAGHASEDVPSWEAEPPPRQLGSREAARRPRGWVDLLTWQSRRLELVVAEGAVTGVVYCVGQGLDDSGLIDPMLPYRKDDVRGLVAIDLSEDRAAWRDSHALIRRTDADGATAPKAVNQLARPDLMDVLGERGALVLDVLGMRGDQAAIKLARHERVTLPSAVLADAERVHEVGVATHALDEVARRLTYAVRDAVKLAIAPGGRDPDKEDVRKATDAIGIQRLFWANMARPFEGFLDALGREEPEAAFAHFSEQIRREARACLRIATAALGTSGSKLHGAAVAERRLDYALREVLPPCPEIQVTTGGVT